MSKQLAVVSQFTDLVATAAGDASLSERTWVLLTEASRGRLGPGRPRHTRIPELVAAARAPDCRTGSRQLGRRLILRSWLKTR